jgi:uncharacterized protein YqjF (DUF2071 family)
MIVHVTIVEQEAPEARDRPTGPIDGRCPLEVPRPWMIHRWDLLTFLHWSYEPEVVARLLPPGLQIETFGGRAWVGLVPFQMLIRPPGLPALPWLSHFPETNVRTYVTAPDGTAGVWFLSLDAARAPAVAVARRGFHLPYYWSEMDVDQAGPVLRYRSRRRGATHPAGRRQRGSEVVVEVGRRFASDELNDRDHWLTARWRLFTCEPTAQDPTALGFQLAQHDPWPLHHARLLHLDQDLFSAAGLPDPVGEPLVHWSPGVEVRIGPRRRVAVASDYG